jgi:hypothetical protein
MRDPDDSEAAKRYLVLDGQHRMHAMKTSFGQAGSRRLTEKTKYLSHRFWKRSETRKATNSCKFRGQ